MSESKIIARYEKLPQAKKDFLWEKLHDQSVSTDEFSEISEEYNQEYPKNRDFIHPKEIQVLYEHFQLGKWQSEPGELEEEVKETLGDAQVEENALNVDEKGKINELNAHRYVLQELYNNYQRIRKGTNEAHKISYLLGISKEITEIKNITATEKNFLSIMDENRKAEEIETAEQKTDSVINWSLPRIVEKCAGKEELKIQLLDLLTKKIEELRK